MQLTAFGAQDPSFFEAIPMQRASAAAEALHVGPPLGNLITCCSSRGNVIAPCLLACGTPSRMLIAQRRHRALPCTRVERRCVCPSHRDAIAPCQVVRETHSPMLTAPQPGRAMPTRVRNLVAPCPARRNLIASCPARVRNAVADAQPTTTPSCQADSRAERRGACSSLCTAIAPCPFACGR